MRTSILLLLVCGLASAVPFIPFIRIELMSGNTDCSGETQSIALLSGRNYDQCQYTGLIYVAYECAANGDLLRYSCGQNNTCQDCQFDINMSECVNGNARYKCITVPQIEDIRGYDGNPLEAQYVATESCEYSESTLQSIVSWKAPNCQGSGIQYTCEDNVYTYNQYTDGVCTGTPVSAVDYGTQGCASQGPNTSYIRTCYPQQVFPIVSTYLKTDLKAGNDACTGETQSISLTNLKYFGKCQYNGSNYAGYECDLNNNLLQYSCSDSACENCQLNKNMSDCTNGNAIYTCVWEPKIEEIGGLDGNPLDAKYSGNTCEFDYPALQSIISWKPANCQINGVKYTCDNGTYTFSQYSANNCQGSVIYELDIGTSGCAAQTSFSEIRTCDPQYFPAYTN